MNQYDVYLNPDCKTASALRKAREQVYWIVDAASEDAALDKVLKDHPTFARYDLRVAKV